MSICPSCIKIASLIGCLLPILLRKLALIAPISQSLHTMCSYVTSSQTMFICVLVFMKNLYSPSWRSSSTCWLSVVLLIPNHISQFRSPSHCYLIMISFFISLIFACGLTFHDPVYPLLCHSISSGISNVPHNMDISTPIASSLISFKRQVQLSFLISRRLFRMSAKCLSSFYASSSPFLDNSSALWLKCRNTCLTLYSSGVIFLAKLMRLAVIGSCGSVSLHMNFLSSKESTMAHAS